MLPLLQRTSSILHASARKYASYAPLPTSASASLPIKDLELPKPESLAAQLLTLGIDENASHRICSTFDRLSEELKSRLEVDYKRRCRSLQPRAHYFHDDKSVSMLSLTYLTWHKKALQTWSSYILENFVPRLIHAKSKLHTVLDNRESGYATKPKRAFNQRAVPILEQFFEGNAFPSRLEKIELADRCNMEYRQIHVWFQNRRSRFRKEGRSFKKRELGAGFVEVFENAVVDELFLCGSVEESSARDSSSETTPNVKQQCGEFGFDAPPHAFPAPYPPVCSYDPFPLQVEKRDFQTPWLRSPRRSSPSETLADVDALIVTFEKLSLVDKFSHEGHQERPTAPQAMPHRPTLKTACSPAPPSLVRRLRSPCHMRTRSIGCALASPVTGRASRSHQCAPPYPPRPSHLIETKPSNITGLSLTPYSRQQKRSLSWRAPRTLPRLAATPSTRRPSISRTFQTPEILSATLPFQHDQSHAGDMDSPLTTPTLPSSTLPSYHLSPRITAFDHDLHVDFPSFISTGDWISASRLQFPYEEAKPLVDAYTLFNISDSPQGDPFV